jgi:hypothetical protein
MNTIFPQEIAVLYTTDPYKSARYQFTTGFGTELGVIVAGSLMRPLGYTNIFLGCCLVVIALFSGLMATLTPNNITPGLAYVTIAQFAGGCVKTIVYVSITYAIPDVLIESTLGVMNLAFTVGPAFGSEYFNEDISYFCRHSV